MSDTLRLTDHDVPMAADEIGGVKHLKVKMEFGADNTATEVSAANPLPVDIGTAAVNINISSGNMNFSMTSGMVSVLSGKVTVLSGEIHVMSGHVNSYITSGNMNAVINSGNINSYITSGNVNSYITSGSINATVVSGNVNSYITSGNVIATINSGNINSYITSGNVNATVVSGNINSYITSGNVIATINSGNINAYITSGTVNSIINSGNFNAYVTSGNVIAQIFSGNVTAAINSGEIHILSGNVNSYVTSGYINILNSGTVVSPSNPFPVSLLMSGGEQATIPVNFGTGSTDAFGRLRVSNPFTLFDSQHRYQINDKWSYMTSGGAAVVYDTNGSLVNLNTNLSSGSQVTCESKRVMPYQPGKSLLIYSTFTMTNIQNNQRQRVGYFGTQNGIYFEMNGTTPSFVLRSFVTGSVIETRKTKGSWNIDNLDGIGPSGYNLNNFNNSMILFIDIEWLGVGDVRVGFVLNGQYVHCHTFRNTPVGGSPISGTYMTTACLPLRYEIANLDTVTSSGNLKQICNSVISEAGYEGFSRRYNADLGTTPKNLAVADTLYPVISIRMAPGRTDSVIIPSNINAIVTSNQNVQYRIVLNGTLAGESWVTHYNGNIQYDTSATTITGGNNIIGGYINQVGILDITNINEFNFQLGRSVNNTSDVFTLCMAPTSANTKVLADLSWFEII